MVSGYPHVDKLYRKIARGNLMYQPPNFQQQKLAYKERYLNWLATKSQTFKLVLGSIILLGVLALCGIFAAIGNAANIATPTPTTAIQQVSHPTQAPTHQA